MERWERGGDITEFQVQPHSHSSVTWADSLPFQESRLSDEVGPLSFKQELSPEQGLKSLLKVNPCFAEFCRWFAHEPEPSPWASLPYFPCNILLRNLLEDFSQAIAAVPMRICPLIRPPGSKSDSWSNCHKRSFPPDHLLHLFLWDCIKNPSYSQELLARHLLFSDSEPACSVSCFFLWMNLISVSFCPRAPGPLLLVPWVCPPRLQRMLSRPPSPLMILRSGSLGDPLSPHGTPPAPEEAEKHFLWEQKGIL